MGKRLELEGQRFGRLVVESFSHKGNDRHSYWRSICECENTIIVKGSNLKTGHTRSCGCLMKETTSKTFLKHGMSESPAYKSWQSMKQRCLNPKTKHYKYYGERGIAVCNKWLKFDNFLVDMGERAEGLTLERRNNNSGYFKENCFWADKFQQANNTRGNRIIIYKGLSLSVTQWARKLNINSVTLRSRLNRRWPTERAFTEKVQARR